MIIFIMALLNNIENMDMDIYILQMIQNFMDNLYRMK
jgi:hypothetical protein